jgi:hypothetical protein
MVCPPFRYETTLTGRCRARPGLFKRQLLQVEWSRQAFSPWPAPPGHTDRAAWREGSKRGEPERFWLDATWDDVQFLGELISPRRTAGYGAGVMDDQQRNVHSALRRLIADDAYAVTFQTTGQYRTALLRALDAAADAAGVALPDGGQR